MPTRPNPGPGGSVIARAARRLRYRLEWQHGQQHPVHRGQDRRRLGHCFGQSAARLGPVPVEPALERRPAGDQSAAAEHAGHRPGKAQDRPTQAGRGEERHHRRPAKRGADHADERPAQTAGRSGQARLAQERHVPVAAGGRAEHARFGAAEAQGRPGQARRDRQWHPGRAADPAPELARSRAPEAHQRPGQARRHERRADRRGRSPGARCGDAGPAGDGQGRAPRAATPIWPSSRRWSTR